MLGDSISETLPYYPLIFNSEYKKIPNSPIIKSLEFQKMVEVMLTVLPQMASSSFRRNPPKHINPVVA